MLEPEVNAESLHAHVLHPASGGSNIADIPVCMWECFQVVSKSSLPGLARPADVLLSLPAPANAHGKTTVVQE